MITDLASLNPFISGVILETKIPCARIFSFFATGSLFGEGKSLLSGSCQQNAAVTHGWSRLINPLCLEYRTVDIHGLRPFFPVVYQGFNVSKYFEADL